jgi:hypothetical protein
MCHEIAEFGNKRHGVKRLMDTAECHGTEATI